jgi:hypothetical protein
MITSEAIEAYTHPEQFRFVPGTLGRESVYIRLHQDGRHKDVIVKESEVQAVADYYREIIVP